MYRSILAVACAVLAVSCVKNPGSETPDPGTDTPDVSHFQTAEQYTVPTKAGQITTVKMNGVTLAEASSPMKIWIPRYAQTKAAAAPEVIYTPADEYPNGFAGNKAQLFQVVCFEDSRSGDYDYNDLVIHVKYQWSGTRFGFGVHPIALGSTKEVRLGAVVYKGSTRIFKGLLAPGNADARTQYFQSQAGFINTGADRQINQRIDGRVTGWNQYLGSTCRCWDLSKIADDGAVRVEWYIRWTAAPNFSALSTAYLNQSFDKQGRPYGLVIHADKGSSYTEDNAKRRGRALDWFNYPIMKIRRFEVYRVIGDSWRLPRMIFGNLRPERRRQTPSAADLGLFRTKSDVNVTDGKYLQERPAPGAPASY